MRVGGVFKDPLHLIYNLGTWQFAFIRAHRTIDVQSENKEPIKVKYLVVQVVNSGKSLITVVTHL